MTQSHRMVLGLALLLEFPILDDIVNPIVLMQVCGYYWLACLIVALIPHMSVIRIVHALASHFIPTTNH